MTVDKPAANDYTVLHSMTLVRPPVDRLVGVSHYSPNPDEPVLFYGGIGSNFVGGPLTIWASHPWAPSEVEAECQTVEHFFQAAKSGTRTGYEHVIEAADPWEAKRRGRRVPLRTDWNHGTCIDAMLIALRAKVAQVDEYAAWLHATGTRYLAEDSPVDPRWGIRDRQGGWRGLNLLGLCHMAIRTELDVDHVPVALYENAAYDALRFDVYGPRVDP